ncbi:hypothetical protein ACSHT0_05685 [Tepidicaulis sp. LMO-SS28]|uniref:hypothetical protein n=1 Tax=Tepidicaulis sp. LMO-SS28 TaxID=3447455 RepID=UPI003EE1F7BD
MITHQRRKQIKTILAIFLFLLVCITIYQVLSRNASIIVRWGIEQAWVDLSHGLLITNLIVVSTLFLAMMGSTWLAANWINKEGFSNTYGAAAWVASMIVASVVISWPIFSRSMVEMSAAFPLPQ